MDGHTAEEKRGIQRQKKKRTKKVKDRWLRGRREDKEG